MTALAARSRRRRLVDIFAIPLVLAVLSAIGLVAALVGDGGWDLLSWATLATPIAVIASRLRPGTDRAR